MFFFFFNDTATTEIYTLSLHDALPICPSEERDEENQAPHADLGPDLNESVVCGGPVKAAPVPLLLDGLRGQGDRKSTRLNSSHGYISYAVFCLKKKNRLGTVCTVVFYV